MDDQQRLSQIQRLQNEIFQREEEIKLLTLQLKDSSVISIRDKFRIWVKHGKAQQLRFLPGGAVRVWVDRSFDIGNERGSMDLLEFEEFECYLDDSNDTDIEKYVVGLEQDQLFMDSVKQMMEENFDSFQIDW